MWLIQACVGWPQWYDTEVTEVDEVFREEANGIGHFSAQV